jgi:hypothetical protein
MEDARHAVVCNGRLWRHTLEFLQVFSPKKPNSVGNLPTCLSIMVGIFTSQPDFENLCRVEIKSTSQHRRK